jgi:hypothetical protein
MAYISLQRAVGIVDKAVDEYKELYKNGGTPHERRVGRIGMLIGIKIKNNLIKEINESDF